VLLSLARPIEYQGIILVFECEQEVLSCPEKPIITLPSFSTKGAKFPTELILQNYNGVVVASTLLEECDEGAAVLSFTKYSLPVAASVEAGQVRDEIANLQVAQYMGFVRLFGHVFYERLETSRLLFQESCRRLLFHAIHVVAL
jgi:hypothetical protein